MTHEKKEIKVLRDINTDSIHIIEYERNFLKLNISAPTENPLIISIPYPVFSLSNNNKVYYLYFDPKELLELNSKNYPYKEVLYLAILAQTMCLNCPYKTNGYCKGIGENGNAEILKYKNMLESIYDDCGKITCRPKILN